jgi:hypothetical protein
MEVYHNIGINYAVLFKQMHCNINVKKHHAVWDHLKSVKVSINILKWYRNVTVTTGLSFFELERVTVCYSWDSLSVNSNLQTHFETGNTTNLYKLLQINLIFIYFFPVEYYHNNKIDDYDRGTAITSTVSGTQTVYQNGSSTPSAIIIQPAHLPFQMGQPGTQTAASVTKQHPVQLPPPYPGVEDIGTAPPPYGEVVYQSGSAYPNPPPVLNANGSEHKVGL